MTFHFTRRKVKSPQDWNLSSQFTAFSGLGFKDEFTLGSIQQLTQFISTDQLAEQQNKRKKHASWLELAHWEIKTPASFPTLIRCHRDKVCWEPALSFSPQDQADVAPCRCQLPSICQFSELSGRHQDTSSTGFPQGALLRRIHGSVLSQPLLSVWKQEVPERRATQIIKYRKKGRFTNFLLSKAQEIERIESCKTISCIKILHAVLHETHAGNSDLNYHPLLKLYPTDRNFSFPRDAQHMCKHDWIKFSLHLSFPIMKNMLIYLGHLEQPFIVTYISFTDSFVRFFSLANGKEKLLMYCLEK